MAKAEALSYRDWNRGVYLVVTLVQGVFSIDPKRK
jgi:hypothetical protein